MNDPPARISLNARAQRLVDTMAADAPALRIAVGTGDAGERLIDAGARVLGGIAAGLALAEICMGGLGRVALETDGVTPLFPWRVVVRSSHPVLACLGSQYAGWKLESRDDPKPFFGMGSGPARALARHEALFQTIDHVEASDRAILVLEAERAPPASIVAEVARACGVAPERMSVLFAPTRSLAGSVQVVARCLEVALSKARQAGFALDRIVEGLATAPLPPPHPDASTAMGRTNDAIIFGGQAHLFVTGPASDARRLAEHLPSRGSRDYGEPFRTIFERAGGDFYAVDPLLFSPAEVAVTAIEGGETYRAGALDPVRLQASLE